MLGIFQETNIALREMCPHPHHLHRHHRPAVVEVEVEAEVEAIVEAIVVIPW